MGIKKGQKRHWEICFIKEDDRINKCLTIRLSQKNINEAKLIKDKLNITYREIFIAGIEALKK